MITSSPTLESVLLPHGNQRGPWGLYCFPSFCARVVCGLHKWDPSLILPVVARDSSCVSPQAHLKGSAVFLVNRCAVDIELLMSGSPSLCSLLQRVAVRVSLGLCTSTSISTGWIPGGGFAKERGCLCTASWAFLWAIPRAVCVHIAV